MTKSAQNEPGFLPQSRLADLPPVLMERALLCAVERKVPLEIPLFVGLSTFSAALGKGLVVQSGRQRETRGNLYILLGVSSGIGKSEVFRDMLEPVLSFERNLHDWWSQEPSVRARAGEELLKAQMSALRLVFRRVPMSAVAIFRLLKDAEGKRLVCSRYTNPPCLLADDATSEALADLMSRSRETIYTVSPDARYSLKRLSTTSSKEETFFLKAFSGDLALSNRITRRDSRLRSPCLSLLYLTQRDAYGGFLKKAVRNQSGLLPRFLHAEISATDEDTRVDLRRASTIRNHYNRCIQGLLEAYRFEDESTLVKPAQSSLEFLRDIEERSRQTAATDESIKSEILRRRAEQCWRVALCLHAARHGATAAAHELTLQDVEYACQIVDRLTGLP
jgi:hypothetical protein